MKNITWIFKQWWFWVVLAGLVILYFIKKAADKKTYIAQVNWIKSTYNKMVSDLKNLVSSEGTLEVWVPDIATVEQVGNLDSLVSTEEVQGYKHVSVSSPEDIDNLDGLELAALATAYLDMSKPGYKWVRNILGSGYVRGESLDQAIRHSLNYWAKQKGLWYKA